MAEIITGYSSFVIKSTLYIIATRWCEEIGKWVKMRNVRAENYPVGREEEEKQEEKEEEERGERRELVSRRVKRVNY